MIQYTTGSPTETGVYACRVRDDVHPELLCDRFFLWHEGAWWFPLSDQRYRGEVLGFVGPLQRKFPA